MKFMILVVALLVAVFFYEAYPVYRAFELSRPIIASTIPYTQERNGARILFAGESTGVGTGAKRPEESVAGRLGEDMPDARIENISKNGARMTDLLLVLQSLPEDARYDSIVLIIGGNDILNFTPTEKVRSSLRQVFAEAKERGSAVYLMTTGDVGNAPAFGPILSRLYSLRTRELRTMFIEESQKAGVAYVDLFMPRDSDPFALEPQKYHAADGVHPSSEGYGIWYGKLKAVLK
ncbi:SGNH/GDSL hydrolase family protein [Patescibacteria group bacterium]|nr:SGNH/GDSL hydrolase family protein [Patescibacteria group bacterium]